MIIHILAILPILGLVAQANSHQLQTPRTAHFSDCFKEEPANLVYRYEGLLSDYPGIRPGCEVQYNGGKHVHWDGPLKWKAFRFFIMDADGVERSVERNGSVTVNVTDLSTKQQVLRTFRWDQVCFPGNCYEGIFEKIVEHCYEPYERYESRILNWLFPNVATRESRLGTVLRHSTAIYCQPPGKIRIPLYSTTPSFPYTLSGQLQEYPKDHGFRQWRGLVYEYKFIYNTTGNGRKYIRCELKIPMDSPDKILRTFYIDIGHRQVVPAALAYQFGRRHTTGVRWTSQLQLEYKDWCFPSPCFPEESYRCENGVDANYLFYDRELSYGTDSAHSVFYISEERGQCEVHTVPTRINGRISQERRLFCSSTD